MSGRIASIVGTFSSAMIRTQFRIITRHHGNENQILPSKVAYRLDKVVSALSTDIIAVSACASEQLCVEGVPDRKIQIIPNGIDINHCSAVREKRNRLLMGKEVMQPLQIGVIARLTDWKGVQFTAEAFCLIREKYPEIRLQIIGAHSDAYPRISQILSTQPSSSYEFVPFDKDVISSFLSFSIFVHVPLETNSETFGLVYLEALATGTPAIFTKSGILNEVDSGDSAIIVKSRSSDSIKEAIDSILGGHAKFSQMSLEFLSTNYSLARMSKQHVALILKALSI
jgi:glycosyltransferase involved in cell wall biosynthesis